MDKEQLRQLKAELRRKYAEKGLEGLDSQEITALLLSYSEKDDFTQLAQTLTQDYGSFSSLADSDPYLLMNCGGVSEQTAEFVDKFVRQIVGVYNGTDVKQQKFKQFVLIKIFGR